MRIDILTVFPGMLKGFLDESILKRAVQMGTVQINLVDLRDFAHDARRTADDRPYGGGPGMIMKPELLFEAIETLKTPATRILLMSPAGKKFDQKQARALTRHEHLLLICGHYEGIDERVIEAHVTDELSIGDYVLTNGALPAAVITDAIVRLLPGVLGGGDQATADESFTEPLLEYPQYTRPPLFRGMPVPAVLQSGNHPQVAAWRRQRALDRTTKRRPDLLTPPSQPLSQE